MLQCFERVYYSIIMQVWDQACYTLPGASGAGAVNFARFALGGPTSSTFSAIAIQMSFWLSVVGQKCKVKDPFVGKTDITLLLKDVGSVERLGGGFSQKSSNSAPRRHHHSPHDNPTPNTHIIIVKLPRENASFPRIQRKIPNKITTGVCARERR